MDLEEIIRTINCVDDEKLIFELFKDIPKETQLMLIKVGAKKLCKSFGLNNTDEIYIPCKTKQKNKKEKIPIDVPITIEERVKIIPKKDNKIIDTHKSINKQANNIKSLSFDVNYEGSIINVTTSNRFLTFTSLYNNELLIFNFTRIDNKSDYYRNNKDNNQIIQFPLKGECNSLIISYKKKMDEIVIDVFISLLISRY